MYTILKIFVAFLLHEQCGLSNGLVGFGKRIRSQNLLLIFFFGVAYCCPLDADDIFQKD